MQQVFAPISESVQYLTCRQQELFLRASDIHVELLLPSETIFLHWWQAHIARAEELQESDCQRAHLSRRETGFLLRRLLATHFHPTKRL